jgi:hypothetical protein
MSDTFRPFTTDLMDEFRRELDDMLKGRDLSKLPPDTRALVEEVCDDLNAMESSLTGQARRIDAGIKWLESLPRKGNAGGGGGTE